MSASPVEIATARADYAARSRAWRSDASAPPDLTPAAVVTLAQRALDDARVVVRFVAASYGGTAPPPPWPSSPEMQTAGRNVEAARDASAAIVSRGAALRWREPAKIRATLLREGGALYTSTGAMLERFAEAPRAPDLLPDPLDFLKGIPALVVVVGVLWLMERGPGRRLA